MHACCWLPSSPPKRQTSTPVAFSDARAKFTPTPSQVAPSGYGLPGNVFISFDWTICDASAFVSIEDTFVHREKTGRDQHRVMLVSSWDVRVVCRRRAAGAAS